MIHQWLSTVNHNTFESFRAGGNDANIGQYNYILCMYKVDARKIQNLNTTKKQIQNQNAVHTELKSPYQYKILNFKFEYDQKTNLESKCRIPDAK